MKRMTTICKGAALLLAVALLTLPLLGLAAPAAEARTLDSATVSGNDAPTVGDSAAHGIRRPGPGAARLFLRREVYGHHLKRRLSGLCGRPCGLQGQGAGEMQL